MGKRLIQFVFSFVLCSILILVLESIAFADQESDFTCSFENGQAIITGYHGQGGDVTIPDTIQGCPVVEVAYNAFDSCNSIKSITFPDSVVKIDNYAFFNCNQMTSFYVNESNPVLSSQDGVLYSKDKKTLLFYPPGRKGEFTIPNGVEDIASSSFPYCIGLTQVTIPDSVVNIERESFMHCTGLRYINIPNGISIINEMSFYYCVNLQNVYFPDSVKEIEYSAFENCDQLTDIVITKNIDYVDPSSFRECDNLVDINVDPDNQNYTSQDGVLYNKEKSVLICFPAGKGGQFIMPDSLTSFYNFYMCNKLTHIKLSNNLTEINSGAFQRCSNLCTIDIPDRAICFDDNAVLDCNSLKKLIFPGYMPTISSISFDSDVVLYYDIIYASSWHASDNMKYEKQPYCIVTVNLLDDSTPIQVMVNLNNNYLVSEPSAPSKNNYSFSGWYKNPDYSAEWDFQNDQINTDITLYAKWTPITYTISFNSQGGSDVLPILGSYNTSIEKPTVPEREGYQFSGWFREQTCKTQWDFSTDVVIGNITLYAQWVADKILVTLNYQDGVTSPVSILVTYGSVYGLQKPLRPGYSFNGWYIDTDDTGTEIQSNTKVTTTSPQTLYAKWTANQYTVKLDAQGGTVVPGSKAVTFDSTYGQLPKPYDRTGYIFEGWYPGKNGSGMQVTDSTPVTITADQTLYASWTANIYHVTFEYQDMVTSPTIGQVSYDSTYKDVLPDPKRSGYDFGGWYTAPNGTGDRISSNTTVTITSDLLLYAKWIAKSFKITLDFQDKATPSAIIWVTFGSTYGEQLKSLFRIGYKFNGWYPGINGSGVKVTESTLVTITDDQKLYASWTANTYHVIFEYQDVATPPTKGTVTYDSTYNGVLPDPKRSGYDFGGWFTAPNGKGSKIENNTKVTTTSAQTLYAKWTAKTYNVTLNFQDKVTSSSIIKVTYGSLYGKLPSPLYTGYTFGGWFTGKDGTGVKITSGMKVSITSPMALYACWTANTYTVTIDFQDGTTHSQSIMVKYASAYGSLPAPNRAGYLFFGWFTEKNGAGTKITAATKETIARNHTLYANWTVDPIPSSVSAVSSGYNSILVKWAAVPNARGYEVYSATAMAGIYTNVGMVTGTSLKNTGLNTGKIYYYKVRSFTLSGSTKIYSDYSVIVPAWPKPAVPTNPKALRKNSTSIKLSWGKVAGATKYEIWRCVAGGNFTLISTVTSNSYINTKLSTGTTYCYEVRAYRQVKKVKVYGEFSSEASAKP